MDYGTISKDNIHTTRIQEKQKGENEEEILETAMAENAPQLMTNTKSETQDTQSAKADRQ